MIWPLIIVAFFVVAYFLAGGYGLIGAVAVCVAAMQISESKK